MWVHALSLPLVVSIRKIDMFRITVNQSIISIAVYTVGTVQMYHSTLRNIRTMYVCPRSLLICKNSFISFIFVSIATNLLSILYSNGTSLRVGSEREATTQPSRYPRLMQVVQSPSCELVQLRLEIHTP